MARYPFSIGEAVMVRWYLADWRKATVVALLPAEGAWPYGSPKVRVTFPNNPREFTFYHSRRDVLSLEEYEARQAQEVRA